MAKRRVKVNVYEILSRAVETGVSYGYRRAHKHTDEPGEELIVTTVHQAVMNELSEVLEFDE